MTTNRDRVVVLIDMDCFYCQVEEKLQPQLKGKPIAVVQYNQWQGGGIIAVNYLARAKGVTRHMRGDEAKKHCPEIQLPSVPCVRGKADISKYREAGKAVAHVLQEYTPLLERASIDEAYMDITEEVNSRMKNYEKSSTITEKVLRNTYVLGYDRIDDFIKSVYEHDDIECDMAGFDQAHSKKLLIGAIIVSEIRSAVLKRTGYECSAGIAHNKIMAKLVCGMNKPNKQTVLPKNRISDIFESLPVNKIKSLGGKFGENVCSMLKISKMNELLTFSEKELQKHFDEKNGSWLYNIARGIDNEPVTPRFTSKSIGCCKKFPGKTAIVDYQTLKHWFTELGKEIEERLTADFAENNRNPTQMVVSYTKELNRKDISCSRSVNLSKEDITRAEILSKTALNVMKKEGLTNYEDDEQDTKLLNPIKFLGISVGKFEDENSKSTKGIKDFFTKDIPSASREESSSSSTNNINEPAPIQDSFIIKYLKTLKTESNKINLNPVPKWIDENSNSNISEGSIDSEINTNMSDIQTGIDRRECSLSIAKFFENHSDNSEEDTNSDTKTYCKECNKHIPESNSTTHSDYHFALTLREEERKNNTAQKAVLQKKPKTPTKHNKQKPDKNSGNILTMFNKINKDNNQQITDNVPCEVCNDCGKNIPVVKLPEHRDYHEAKKLHEELNKSNKVLEPMMINKRKLIENIGNKEKKGKLRTISSFFHR